MVYVRAPNTRLNREMNLRSRRRRRKNGKTCIERGWQVTRYLAVTVTSYFFFSVKGPGNGRFFSANDEYNRHFVDVDNRYTSRAAMKRKRRVFKT